MKNELSITELENRLDRTDALEAKINQIAVGNPMQQCIIDSYLSHLDLVKVHIKDPKFFGSITRLETSVNSI